VIGRGQAEVLDPNGSIYSIELHECASLNISREFPREPPMEDSLGVPAAERLDHNIDGKQPVY
jgi:hypothetical protein